MDRAAALGWPDYSAAVQWKFRPQKNGACDWETARRLWLEATDETMATGRKTGADRRSLYQAVRWIARRRTIGDVRTIGRGAVVRILHKLARIVEERGALSASLKKDWTIFN